MDWKIPLADIDFDSREEAAVLEVLKSRWLTMGAVTQSFEEEFASFVGARHAIAVANGTAALHLACLGVGLGRGDEVIVPSLTFVATANAVRYTGAIPIFADIESEQDLDISANSIEQMLTERTRAIVVMHYGGYVCDMPAITKLARAHNLMVIEDAAHAIGSELEGRKTGVWSDVGCFSFFSNKNMTTGEGGMVVTNDDGAANKMRILRSHGMTTMSWDRHRGHAWSYDVVELGYNYRIDEIRAALGRVQLSKLEQNNKRRRNLSELYREQLEELIPSIVVPFNKPRGMSACHLLPILLPDGCDRIGFMEHMKSNGIQTSIHYPPIHKFKTYTEGSGALYNLPLTENVAGREVTLPLYPGLTDENVADVVHAVQGAIHKAKNNIITPSKS
jgi:dTDP-4-amino-4,6-dideoxygalactose transaminase